MHEDKSFAAFIGAWNEHQGQDTPEIHKKMADWLERAWEKNKTRLLLLAFRASGKSTICGLFAAWLLFTNPDLRILVLAADHALARKMVRNVRRIIERHSWTASMMIPKKADEWASDRFTIARKKELRDPSMLARGITSNITGSRADVIICDDVEVPGTSGTAEKREALRARLQEAGFVLIPGGSMLYLGTPHNYYSIYADEARGEISEDTPFLDGYERMVLPLLDERGESVWPERYPPEDIELIKRASGPNMFASQMLLRPVSIADGRLDADALQYYEGRINYNPVLDELCINDKKMADVRAWWDPAFGDGRGDHSTLAVVFTDEDGALWLHRLLYIKIDPGNKKDAASQQCEQVAKTAQDLRLPGITVEINGIGKFLPSLLRRQIDKIGIPCRVLEKSNRKNKSERILEAFDAPLAAQMFYVHESVKDTPFVMEMREWKPGSKKGHDDGLDATACAILEGPVRLRHYPARDGGQTWTLGTKMYQAKTEFPVL